MNQKTIQKAGWIFFIGGMVMSLVFDPLSGVFSLFSLSIVSIITGGVLMRWYEPLPPKRDPSQASTIVEYMENRMNGNTKNNADLDKEILPDKVIKKVFLYSIFGILLLLSCALGGLLVLSRHG